MNEQAATHQLSCPLCKGTNFSDEKARLDSRWGMTEHMTNMKICDQCGYVLLFSKGRTWWVVDG